MSLLRLLETDVRPFPAIPSSARAPDLSVPRGFSRLVVASGRTAGASVCPVVSPPDAWNRMEIGKEGFVESAESVTELLSRSREGDARALDRLVPFVYDELRAIAHGQLRGERSGHTLSTTALVSEAYLRLVDQRRADWRDRRHFFAVAARMMRRVLVDYARRRGARKREGVRSLVPLEDALVSVEQESEMLLSLDEALTRLAVHDTR